MILFLGSPTMANGLTVGKELRLKQQYFWTASSLADILRRFKNLDKPIVEFPDCEDLRNNHSLSQRFRILLQMLPSN